MDGTAAAGLEPEPRALRVLVLDNDRTMRDLLAFALAGRGIEAVVAGQLAEAEAALSEVDGLLLDFQLSDGHTGSEVARRWAAEGRLPPFWLVTGMPEDPEVRALEELEELRGVVGKPFSLLELAEGVEDTLRNLARTSGAEENLSPLPETTWEGSDAHSGRQPVEPPQILPPQEDGTDPPHSSGPDSVA